MNMAKNWRQVAMGVAVVGGVGTNALAGTLFIGTDTEEFNGLSTSYLGVATVSGANFVSETVIPLNFALNGIGDGPGFLYAGSPSSNTLNTVSYGGALLSSVAAGFPASCCNEEMQFAGGSLYHAHWSDSIQQIDPVTGAVIQTFSQPQVVGMALVGSQLWITHWADRTVGIWDPVTNIYTAKFSTPQLAGALAFDPTSNILWVGQLGGMVIPYDLAGNQLNGGFDAVAAFNLPSGTVIDTVDGLTFLGEGTQQPIPEPSSLALLGIALGGFATARRRKEV